MTTTPENRPQVSVVCLSYNRPELLSAALESLQNQTLAPAEIWVVDNRSPRSEEVAALVESHPGARLLSLFRNRGFTGGMNAGIDVATGDYLLLTEDDLWLEPKCLERFVEYAARQSRPGLLSGLMLNQGTGTIRCAGGSLYLGPRYRKEILAAGDPDRGQFLQPFQVAYVPGALMFAPTELFRRLHGFRKDFFAYYEDDDLCLRIARSGGTITVVPAARGYHVVPPETPPSMRIRFHQQKNFLSLYALHAPLSTLLSALWRYGVGELLRPSQHPRWLLLRARLWFLLNLPRLLLDRWQFSIECRRLLGN